MPNIATKVDRRTALKRIGATGILGLTTAVGTSSAHAGGDDHLSNGAVFDCYIQTLSKFDAIYNSMSDWENSFVTLNHSDWDGDVKLRVGEVNRVYNEVVQNYHNYYVDNKNGKSELGDNRMIMLAGSWSTDMHNHWNAAHHIGLINSSRCASSGIANKYWYHEFGHAHTLPDRESSGALMAPGDWLGMRLNSDETEQWRNAYSQTSSASTSTLLEQDGFEQTEDGTVARDAGTPPGTEVEDESFETPTLVDSEPL